MPTRAKKDASQEREAQGLSIEPNPFPLTPLRASGAASPYAPLAAATHRDGSAIRPVGTEHTDGRRLADRRVAGTAEILTIRDVAVYLKLPVSTVYRLAERRELPGHKVGRQWRFHKSILDEWFRQHAATDRVAILVVDDEDVTRQFIASALQMGQRQIVTAASGEEAVELAKQGDFDLALLDLVMPGISGVETFRQLHAVKPDLPVVIVTGYPDSDQVAKALEIGPFTLINKPIDVSHLQKVVGLMVGQ
jgi:excisionase family DNA binding protein